MKTKIMVVSFFPVYPVTFGSSVVISSFFENIPFKNKTLYQLSSTKIKDSKKIKNIFAHNKIKFLKFIAVLKLIKKIFFDLYNSKKNNLVFIEGASWIGYSFILILVIKFFFWKVKVIYRGHSIEYEIRKKNSNFLISSLSFFFEKFVYKNSYISTSVSNLEKQKVKKLYGINTLIFPNIIKFYNKKKIKSEFKKKYIFYSGSYEYIPNKKAIDRLFFEIMPKLHKENPHIQLILTGSRKIPHKAVWLKNLGLISKNRYLNILRNSICLIVPTNEGYGTRVKIIEALCYGAVVVSTKIGIEGIEFQKNYPPPFKCSSDKSFIKTIIMLTKSKKYKKIATKNKKFYIQNYSAKQKTMAFMREIL